MTSEERSDISNGIWLCATHARLIDRDESTYTADDLRLMKAKREKQQAIDQAHPRMVPELTPEVIAILRKLSEDRGIDEVPLRSILERLGEPNVKKEDMIRLLDEKATEYLELKAKLTSYVDEDEQLSELRKNASVAVDQGRFDAARAELRLGREMAQSAAKKSMQAEAAFLSDEALLDQLSSNYSDALAKLQEAANLDADNPERWRDLGVLWGLKGSLREAQRAFEAAQVAAKKADDQKSLADCLHRLSEVHSALGDDEKAKLYLSELEKLINTRFTAEPNNPERLLESTQLHLTRGLMAVNASSLSKASEHFDAARLIANEQIGLGQVDEDWLRASMTACNRLGAIRRMQGEAQDAIIHFHSALRIANELLGRNPNSSLAQRDLAVAINQLGIIYHQIGDLYNAKKYFERDLSIAKHTAAADNKNSKWQLELSISYSMLGQVEIELENLSVAKEYFIAALSICKRLNNLDPCNVDWMKHLAQSHHNLMIYHSMTGDFRRASAHEAAKKELAFRKT